MASDPAPGRQFTERHLIDLREFGGFAKRQCALG
jgi:hypothetical protein